jgi:hypothetical protein
MNPVRVSSKTRVMAPLFLRNILLFEKEKESEKERKGKKNLSTHVAYVKYLQLLTCHSSLNRWFEKMGLHEI